MAQYKLTYFDLRGLGEQTRLLLTDQKIAFTDERISFDKWPEYKANMAFGQIPCLYDGDMQLCQSGAIMRHLARKHDLYGSTLADHAYIDMFHDGVADLRTKYLQMIYRNYENGRAEFVEKTMPSELQKFEKLLQNKPGGFANGPKISFVDYTFFELMSALVILSPTCLEAFPTLSIYYKMVSERPNLEKYLGSEQRINSNVNGNGKQ